MERNVNIAFLMDYYMPLLTQRQREILSLHFFEDLSYGEIASELSITRQAVADAVRTASDQLLEYERKLRLYKKDQHLQASLAAIRAALSAGQKRRAEDLISELQNHLYEEDDNAL